MLIDATMLALVGVGIVFAFLVTLVILLHAIARVAAVAEMRSGKSNGAPEEVAAAIAAAYHAEQHTRG